MGASGVPRLTSNTPVFSKVPCAYGGSFESRMVSSALVFSSETKLQIKVSRLCLRSVSRAHRPSESDQ